MKLIESYALNTGLKIGKPVWWELFFPLPFDKYILVHAGGGNGRAPAKVYDYFDDVLTIMRQFLERGDYKVIQVGLPDEHQIKGAIDLRGKTNVHTLRYLIRNASLLLCNDSVMTHLAGYIGTPFVCVYGPTTVKNHSPYWLNTAKYALIESDRDGKKASYSTVEHPKTINRIKPEQVANAGLQLLGFTESNLDYETLYIGDGYKFPMYEVVPGTLVPPNLFKGILTIRQDYGIVDEGFTIAQCSACRCSLVIDKPITLESLRPIRPNLANVIYKLDGDEDMEFAKALKAFGVPYLLVSEKEGDELHAMKARYLDFNPIQTVNAKKLENVPQAAKVTKDTFFRVHRLIISNGKFYPTRWHMEMNEPLKSAFDTEAKVKMTPEFWKELELFNVYNKKV